MKQNEVKTGESYLFVNTDVEHRKNMIGTIVTVCRKVSGGTKDHYQDGILTGKGKKPIRFKLTNGQFANASNLREIK